MRYRPYAEDILNRIELCSLVLAASMLFLGLFLFVLVVTAFLGFIITLCMHIKASRFTSSHKDRHKVNGNAAKTETGFEMAVDHLRRHATPSSENCWDGSVMENPISKYNEYHG